MNKSAEYILNEIDQHLKDIESINLTRSKISADIQAKNLRVLHRMIISFEQLKGIIEHLK